MAGAGPAGLALALQAHDHGAAVRVIDRRPEAFRPSRALIMHARTLEVLRPLGVTQALLARADTAPAADLHLGGRVVRVRLGELRAAGHRLPAPDADPADGRRDGARRGAGRPGGRGGARHRAGRGARGARRCPGGCCARRPEPRRPASVSSPAATARPAPCGPRPGSAGPAASYPVEVVLADAELDGDLPGGAAHVVAGRDGLLFAFPLGERATWRLLATRPARRGGRHPGRSALPVPPPSCRPLFDDAGLGAQITELRLVRAGQGAAPGRQPVPPRPAVPGRGRRARLLPGHRPGYERRHPGRRQPRLEARVRASGQAGHGPLLDSYDRERRPVARQVLALTHLVFWAEAGTGRSRPRSVPSSRRSPPRWCPRWPAGPVWSPRGSG